MARKGILPRRKRGRTAIPIPYLIQPPNKISNTSKNNGKGSISPSNEPPFHFAQYKLPELRTKLI